jgi:hypothetical protein
VTELNRRINVLAKHCIEQQFKDLEEDVAGVKRAHAAILRGKPVSVNFRLCRASTRQGRAT